MNLVMVKKKPASVDDDFQLQPPPDASAATKATSDGSTIRVEEAFKAAYEKRWGFTLMMNPPRDRRTLKRLIGAWGEDAIMALIDFFFTTTDPQITRVRDYNVPNFEHWAPYMRRMMNGHGPRAVHERTAETLREIRKATGRQ